MKKHIVIFCQAPSDIQYFLTLYEKYERYSLISVYIINVENVYRFIINSNLNLYKCEFIPYYKISLKNPLKLIQERNRVNKIILQNFKNLENCKIYFFSIYEDWLTAAFIKALSIKNRVCYIDYYDFSANIFKKKRLTFRLLLQKLCYWFITGIVFKFEIQEKIPEFNYLNYNIIKKDIKLDYNILKKYQYFVTHKNEGKNVIFFISPCESSIFNQSTYDDIQLNIINKFKLAGWKIFIKGHPRIGTPKNIKNITDFEIPSYIPAEFLNLDGFNMIFGIITSSIAHFALNTEISTYTLINLFDYIDNQYKSIYTEYLQKLSKNRIIILENNYDLTKLLN